MPPNTEQTQIDRWQSPELEPIEGMEAIDQTLMSLQLAVGGYLNMDKRSREVVQRSTELVLSELANTRSECRRIADRANRRQANMLKYHRREIVRTVIVAVSLAAIAIPFLTALFAPPKTNAQNNQASIGTCPSRLHQLPELQSWSEDA